MNNKIKHIFFDLDHTLWDFDKNSSLTFQKIFKIHNVEISLKDFLRAYEPINLKYWKLYREEKISKSDLRYNRLRDVFDEINVNVSDKIINNLSEDYINYLSSFNNVFEGTFEILEYLKPKYQLHIITNGFREAQQKKMISSKLKPFFVTVTDSEAVGVKKPNPKIFDYALNIAKAKADESIMIGDNFEADILGALNVGMDAICYNYHNLDLPKHIKRVSYLAELKKIF